jgi:hypothetical protein
MHINAQQVRPRSLLARALTYLRERGLRSLPGRLRRELFSPSTVLGHRLRPILRAPRSALARWRHGDSIFAEPSSLVAFYDCEIAPITYDFCWFAVAAELERRRRGFERVRFVIVAGRSWDSGPESADYLSVIDAEQRRLRVFDILVPIAGLLPTQDGIALITSRRLATRLAENCYDQRFPEHYFPEFPGPEKPFSALVCDAARRSERIPSLMAPEGSLRLVRKWIERICNGRPLVAITLRHSPYLPQRNSNIESWARVARKLKQRGYCPVVVPDTGQTLMGPLEAFEDAVTFPEAAWNVLLRAALYEEAFVNLGVNSGPMGLCWLNARCRHLTFKLSVEGEHATSAEFHQSLGLAPHDPFPFSGPFQRVFAAADEEDVILREFDRLCTDLKAHDSRPDTRGAE